MSTMNLPLDIRLDPLIAEAKRRARRRRLLALVAAGLIAAGLLASELAPSGAGGGVHGTIPWLPTKPSFGPANPPLAAPCTASQLRASLTGTGVDNKFAAEIDLMNRSSTACALVGRPSFSSEGWRVTPWHSALGMSLPNDPLVPARSLRALRPGAHAQALVWISGSCRMVLGGPNDRLSSLVLTAPGGGTIDFSRATSRSCNSHTHLTVRATRYTTFVPPGKRRSELPLSARTVFTGLRRTHDGGTLNSKHVLTPGFLARAGSWLSYTVVLKNRSRDVFRFGKTCPSYTEGIARTVAYVLNCHPVGSIGPGKSVRFAMRMRVPPHDPSFGAQAWSGGWTLSPHTYDAPEASWTIEVR